MFYYEEKMMTGHFSPRTSPDRPSAKTPSGGRINIRNVQEVPAEMHMFDLDTLHEIFSPVVAQ